MFANGAWPRVVSRETMHTIWECIEFIGNTLVFFIAGLIFGNICLSRKDHITIIDYGYLLLLYVAVTMVRLLMILVLWYPLNKTGTPITWKEALIMTWSGLRGAVSLAMAIIVDLEPGVDKRMGSRIMFHVGGIAALTTFINATTVAGLLRLLGLSKASELRKRMLTEIEGKMALRAKDLFDAQIRAPDDVRFDGANADIVRMMVPALSKSVPSGLMSRAAEGQPADVSEIQERSWLHLYREVFLKIVQNHYWDAINDGIISRHSHLARTLLHSTNAAMDRSHQGLCDWDLIEESTNRKPSWLTRFHTGESLSSEQLHLHIIYGCLSFLDAHHRAQEEVPAYFQSASGVNEALLVQVEQQINIESTQECQRALQQLQALPVEKVTLAKSKMLARRLLNLQIDEVQFLKSKGVIAEMEASELEHNVHEAIRHLLSTPPHVWLQK